MKIKGTTKRYDLCIDCGKRVKGRSLICKECTKKRSDNTD